jgi:hypothetical protein
MQGFASSAVGPVVMFSQVTLGLLNYSFVNKKSSVGVTGPYADLSSCFLL